ncbi:MAG TPA: hypothetical protein VHK06_07925 [Candidatus Limnocylindria bacterium]|nr:hypothetical protein [Candidatus Limnocylindria bacterium]
MTSAALGVDAVNEQRALRLYEAGFALQDRFVAFRKPLTQPP